MDPRDYIDPDEGREDSPEPKLPTCGSCGKPAAEVNRCVWDATLMVGTCCENYTEKRCPDCGSDNLTYTLRHPDDVDHYSAACNDCGMHTDDGEGDLLNITIGPAHPIQPALFPELQRKPARKEVARKEVA